MNLADDGVSRYHALHIYRGGGGGGVAVTYLSNQSPRPSSLIKNILGKKTHSVITFEEELGDAKNS